MTVSNDNTPRRQFTVPLACPDCAQKGSVTWEETGGAPQGGERRLVGVSSGFHEERGRTQTGAPVIVCDVCDTIQDD